MGRQIVFFMTANDEREFMEFVRSDREACVFANYQPAAIAECLNELPLMKPPYDPLWLWDSDNSPYPLFTHIAKYGVFVVDDSKSEVIQFDRCLMHDECLVMGRIWAEMYYCQPPASSGITDMSLAKKSISFTKWYSRLANWIVRHSIRDSNGVYVLCDARRFAAEGGHFHGSINAMECAHGHKRR